MKASSTASVIGLASTATGPVSGGAFVHQSPASSRHHDPLISLASNIIRDTFGPTVQTVADCLQCRGEMTFAALRKYLQATSTTTSSITTPQIRASLLVLLQHSIVTVKRQTTNIYLYTYHTQPAIHIHRYAKFVEYTKKAVDATAACCIEELLLAGRLRTVDLTVQAAERAPKSEKYTVRQSVMDAFCKLVNSGFIQRVTPLPDPMQNDDDDDDQEEFQFDEPRPRKRVKIEASSLEQDLYRDEDPAVVGLLQAHGNYRETLPIDAVWRVNIDLYHDILRAFHLGRLTAEIHGARVQSAGSLVTAALRYRAQQKHGVSSATSSSNNNNYESTVFAVQDVVKFLPKPVTQLLEKKPGGLAVNLNKAWRDLSELRSLPVAVRRVADDRYEIAVRSVTRYLQDRIFYQVVHDRHGEVAARVVSILSRKGWLESDPLSEMCMVPSQRHARGFAPPVPQSLRGTLSAFVESAVQPSQHNLSVGCGPGEASAKGDGKRRNSLVKHSFATGARVGSRQRLD